MRPTSIQNKAKMHSWSLLGARGAPGGRPGPSKTASERLLGGLLAALGALLAPLGPLLALPGGSRRVPGSLREVIFGAFFGGRRRDPEISWF